MARPTSYTDDMPDEILRLMSQGLTMEAAAGKIGITRRTILNWKKDGKHPELEDAIEIGQGKRQAFWEERLLSPEITSAIAKVTLKALENTDPDNWRSKQDINHTSSDGSMTPKVITHQFVESFEEKEANSEDGNQ